MRVQSLFPLPPWKNDTCTWADVARIRIRFWDGRGYRVREEVPGWNDVEEGSEWKGWDEISEVIDGLAPGTRCRIELLDGAGDYIVSTVYEVLMVLEAKQEEETKEAPKGRKEEDMGRGTEELEGRGGELAGMGRLAEATVGRAFQAVESALNVLQSANAELLRSNTAIVTSRDGSLRKAQQKAAEETGVLRERVESLTRQLVDQAEIIEALQELVDSHGSKGNFQNMSDKEKLEFVKSFIVDAKEWLVPGPNQVLKFVNALLDGLEEGEIPVKLTESLKSKSRESKVKIGRSMIRLAREALGEDVLAEIIATIEA